MAKKTAKTGKAKKTAVEKKPKTVKGTGKTKGKAESTWTHLTVLLDRSGSMSSIATDVIGGFNHFLEKQKALPGAATLTLVQFDSVNPFDVIHHQVPVGSVPALTAETFVPRGGTPLLDAMGRTMADMDQLTGGMPSGIVDGSVKGPIPKSERVSLPDRVVFVVITDGQENQSREWNHEQVSKMIQERQEKQGWQVVFLSADMAAIGEARNLGVRHHSSSRFRTEDGGTLRAMQMLADQVSSYRTYESEEITLDEKKLNAKP